MRKRCTNFSVKEIDTLVTLLQEYQGIVECKRTDHITNSKKEEAWDRITEIFNNSVDSGRTKDNLKGKWDSMKKATRKKLSDIKMGIKKTGGGPSPFTNLDSVTERVLGIIGISATGISNNFDCDANDEIPATQTTVVNDLPSTSTEIIENVEIETVTNIAMPAKDAISEWKEWSPAMLRQPINDLLVVPFLEDNTGQKCIDEPDLGKTQKIPEKSTPTQYRLKKKRGICNEKEIYTQLAKKKIELIDLQVELIRKDSEEKRKQAKEKHFLEIEILKTELEIKQKQLEDVKRS